LEPQCREKSKFTVRVKPFKRVLDLNTRLDRVTVAALFNEQAIERWHGRIQADVPVD